jgi:hypothetical protein
MMSNLIPMSDIVQMARVMSPLFSKKEPDAIALMLIAQAEGKHPAIALQEWDIIQGRPALKASAVLGRFQQMGGKIQWLKRSDTICSAKFSHAQGGEVEIEWTIERAQKAGLTSKDNWRKFPTQMLSARVSAEGVRCCFPACLNGFYIEDEVEEMTPNRVALDPQKEVKQEPKVIEQNFCNDENFQKLSNAILDNIENWKPQYLVKYKFTPEQLAKLEEFGIKTKESEV